MRARILVSVGIAVLVILGWYVFRDSDTPVHAKPEPANAKKRDPAYRVQARRIDRETRARMVEALTKLRDTRAEPDTVDTVPTVPGPKPALPERDQRTYIRAAVKEIVPLLGACYEAGLERDPTLAGTVVVEFTIEGEVSVGGLIGNSTIDDESTIRDQQVRECIQETMYAIRIDPPLGEEVRVRYPFVFRPAR